MSLIKNLKVPNIRILPTSPSEECFSTLSKAYYFYTTTLKSQNGYYKFRALGLNSPPQSIILFQYRNNIVASAILLKDSNSLRKSKYPDTPSMRVDVDSIAIFNPPISFNALKSICPTLIPFSDKKQIIDNCYVDALNAFIRSRKI